MTAGTNRRRTTGAAATVTVLAAVTLAVSACTSSSPSKSPSSSAPTGAPSTSSSTPSATVTAPSSTPASSASATGTVGPHPSSSPATPSVQPTQPSVALTKTATFQGKVTGSIVSVKAINATAVAPGEVSGPGLSVTIKINNGSAAAINLADAVVNLTYGSAQTPGGPMSGPPAEPFKGTLAAGKSVTGVYVFTVSKAGQSGAITISVSYAPTAPIVVFSGQA